MLVLAGCGGNQAVTSDPPADGGVSQGTSAEKIWLDELNADTSGRLAELRRLHQEMSNELLSQLKSGTPDYTVFSRVATAARSQASQVLEIIRSSEPAPGRTTDVATGLTLGLNKYIKAMDAYSAMTQHELGSLEQIELGDRGDQLTVASQRELMTAVLTANALAGGEIPEAVGDVLEFMAAYNRTQVSYAHASKLDIAYLKALGQDSFSVRETIRRARAARKALGIHIDELRAIPPPEDDELREYLAADIRGVEQVLNSYSLAVTGFRERDEDKLERSDIARQQGFTASAESQVGLINRIGELANREDQ